MHKGNLVATTTLNTCVQHHRNLFHWRLRKAWAALPQIFKSDQHLEQPVISDFPERHQVFTLGAL